ncbi:MAG: alanine racemase [Proteobacteria bacterium]|nr:alanine racemase [Pseudomonadota bacterium]
MANDVCATGSSRLTIDLDAIRANYRLLAARVAPAACGAVVKADAYGLGAAQVAPVLRDAGCGIFFVAQLCEAIELRAAIGAAGDIFILNGLDPGCEALCAAHGFVPVLNSASQAARWRALARERGAALPAALQVDSGMSRLGLDAAAVEALAGDAGFAREVSLRLLMTHLACADEPDNPANAAQLARFGAARALFPGVPASIANSGGSFLPDGFHCDVARAGIALYGAPPSALAEGLRPVAALSARVIQIRAIGAGTGVGYGLDYVARERRRLATIGIGYADGWPRPLSGTGAARHQGRRLPIVGRVSMDSMTVDISALADDALSEGDFVELLGTSQSLDDVAGDAGTISYEILTQLGRRHRRLYVDGAQQ